MNKKKAGKFRLTVLVGIIAIIALALGIKVFFEKNGIFPVISRDGGISDYLALVGVSFSVRFITTSQLGGLSDKTGKIYWRPYPEAYLINSALNFNSITTLGFICLGVQTAMMLLPELDALVRESVFLSAFIISIVSIIVLTYKFTAVFFSRKRLLKDARSDFGKMVADTDSKEELRSAVVGIVNNSVDAASHETCNLQRLCENVNLLLDYEEKDDSDICSFRLSKLIIEIGRVNYLMLIQLTTHINRDVFFRYLERQDFKDSLPYESAEVLKAVYQFRLNKLAESLGGEGFLSGGEHFVSADKANRWAAAAAQTNIILKKIALDSHADCILWLTQITKLPYDLLKHDACYDTVLTGWDRVCERFAVAIRPAV